MDFRGVTMKIIVQKFGGTSVRDEESRNMQKNILNLRWLMDIK